MHSFIVQLTAEPINLADSSYMSPEDLYDDYHLGDQWDYLQTLDRNEGIRWLRGVFKNKMGATFSDELEDGDENRVVSFTIPEGAKKKFFEPYYKEFEEALKLLWDEHNFEAFMSLTDPIHEAIWNLKESEEHSYNVYVMDDDDGVITLDRFMRKVDEGDTYYVGGFVDYHF